MLQNFGDAEQQIGVDVLFMEYLGDGAGIARKLRGKPDVGAALALEFLAYQSAYMRVGRSAP